MDQQRRVLSVGTVVIIGAVVLRLLSSGALTSVVKALEAPEIAAFLMYLETGRVVRPLPEETLPEETEPTDRPTEPTQPREPLEFTADDAQQVFLRDNIGLSPDIETLLQLEQQWDLTAQAPTVLILHTHATESYTQTVNATYQESADYRTLDTDHNMVAVGEYVAQLLEAAGIGVVHAKDLHDYPSYNDGYGNSRATAQHYLEQYPSIQLVLDLHRDAGDNGNGGQMDTSASVDGQESAQLMFLIGAGETIQSRDWLENLALAAKMTAILERQAPGITRGIMLRSSRYNHDLSPGAMLVEVGSAGNTQAEAMIAARELAEAIITLSQG